MPFRHPIVSVVGRPITVTQSDKPTQAELEEVQRRYIEELTTVWNSYKDLYAPARTKELSIIA